MFFPALAIDKMKGSECFKEGWNSKLAAWLTRVVFADKLGSNVWQQLKLFRYIWSKIPFNGVFEPKCESLYMCLHFIIERQRLLREKLHSFPQPSLWASLYLEKLKGMTEDPSKIYLKKTTLSWSEFLAVDVFSHSWIDFY